MTDNFAARFQTKYSRLSEAWKRFAQGETPDSLPPEWRGVNYYASVYSRDAEPRVKAAAQAFLSELDAAKIDAKTYIARLTLATQTFAQVICQCAGIRWNPALRSDPVVEFKRSVAATHAPQAARTAVPVKTATANEVPMAVRGAADQQMAPAVAMLAIVAVPSPKSAVGQTAPAKAASKPSAGQAPAKAKTRAAAKAASKPSAGQAPAKAKTRAGAKAASKLSAGQALAKGKTRAGAKAASKPSAGQALGKAKTRPAAKPTSKPPATKKPTRKPARQPAKPKPLSRPASSRRKV